MGVAHAQGSAGCVPAAAHPGAKCFALTYERSDILFFANRATTGPWVAPLCSSSMQLVRSMHNRGQWGGPGQLGPLLSHLSWPVLLGQLQQLQGKQYG